MKNVACFDIGGTFIKYGILDENGIVLYKDKFATPNCNCNQSIPIALSEKFKEMNKIHTIDCIGISTAGQVDSTNGQIIFSSENIPGYTGTKLSEKMLKLTGLKCNIENDVNCAAVGELWKGSKKDTFFFMTLGTGIGGAFISNGKLFKGIGGNAGEVGHMIINENGEKCTCGGIGCLERYGSVSSLVRNYATASNTNVAEVDGEKIMKLVNSGDAVANKIYSQFIDHIVTGIINITYILDPGVIIIGGGISEQEDVITQLNYNFQKSAMPSYVLHTKIISSSLKNDAGLIGACYIGLNYNK